MRNRGVTGLAGVVAITDDEAAVERSDWYSAAELAELALPGLPGDKRSIARRIRDERWQLRSDAAGEPLSRPRIGRGGGTEFHIALLPGAARLDLARRGLCGALPGPVEVESAAFGSWRWYEGQSGRTKAEAQRRAGIVRDIELLEASGLTRTAALAESSRRHGVSPATLWNWLRLVEGVAPSDRLPALAPRRQGGGVESDIDPLIWTIFKSDWLRLEAPTLTSCYARCAAIAAEKGLLMPSEKTFRRRIERDIDPRVVLLRRKGEEPLRRSLPAQRRSVEELSALELVNIDGHRFDVFVKHPDPAITTPIRPLMVALQDIYSSKFVAWRVGTEETAMQTRLAFADLFANYGIPKGCVLDNGRAFASKWITGGAKTRFRFKIKPEDPTGLLTGLGIHIHWALPYRGQSKPIERAFRDLCDSIAKHPAMAGAYVGNKPTAKPENYGSRAIEWAEFVAHVERGMAAHNAKLGRRGRNYRGRSFDEVFAQSYAATPIGKASPEQLRMALLAAEGKRIDRRTGEVTLYGNRYWSDGCAQLHGQLVTVRFDPDDLAKDIHLYAQDGRYLTAATMIADSGFQDVAEAKTTAKKVADYRRRIRDGADAEQLLEAHAVAACQVDAPRLELVEPNVIRPVRPNLRNRGGQTAAALKAEPAPQPQNTSRIFAALGKLKVVE